MEMEMGMARIVYYTPLELLYYEMSGICLIPRLYENSMYSCSTLLYLPRTPQKPENRILYGNARDHRAVHE